MSTSTATADAVVVPFPSRRAAGPSRLLGLKQLVCEVSRLGVRSRLSGADVVIDGADALPHRLREQLFNYDKHGWLWAFLGGEAADAPTIRLLAQLGITARLVETRRGARDAIRQIERDKRDYGEVVGLDIETTPKPGLGLARPYVRLNSDGSLAELQAVHKDPAGLDPYRADIAALQLYAGGSASFVFRSEALHSVVRSHWLRRQHLASHNATFETLFLSSIAPPYHPPPGRSPRPGRLECTQQLVNLLIGVKYDLGRSLADAARILLKTTLPKELQLSDWGAARLSQGQLAYAALDAIFARRLWLELAGELQRKDRYDAYLLQRRAIPSVAAMQKRGMKLDLAEHRRQIETWTRSLTDARRGYETMMRQPPPVCDNDVRDWLRLVLRREQLERWPRTSKKGDLSVAVVDLKYLTDIPSMPLVVEIKRYQQLLNNFGAKLVEKVSTATGRIHCSFILAGTKAGRFSSQGPNLQQLPGKRAPEFKKCIVAEDDCRLIVCDWSLVELRALAWLSNDPGLTQAFADGIDLHKDTAARINRIAIGEVSAQQRQVGKTINFATIYGGGPKTLVAQIFLELGILLSEAEARQMQEAFWAPFPAALRWRLDNHERCKRQGYVRIGCGRTVEARWEASRELSFAQHCDLPIQGICADAMLRAVTLTHARLRQLGINGGLIATIHDELVVEAVGAEAAAAAMILQESMITAFAETFPGAPVNGVATAKIGRSWAEVK